MGSGRFYGDHQVKVYNHGGQIIQERSVKAAAEVDNRIPAGQIRQLLRARAHLQAQQLYAINARQWLKVSKRNRAILVELIPRISLPNDANLETPERLDLFFPRSDPVGVGMHVRNVRWNCRKRRAEDA